MPGSIFLMGDDGELLEMSEQPYEAETVLQELVASHPRLLAGDRGSGTQQEWLLVSREAALPSEPDGAGRWSVDHLFLDQEGVPTLVEVKRSSDTRIRREVVGQMLDYAANAVVYWPIEAVQGAFEETCRRDGLDSDARLSLFLGEAEPEEFWVRTKTNLQAGRVRMVFVADAIPGELRRIVEFLNEQMDPAEVLAIEVRQFVGGGRRTLVPKLVGQTAEAERRKSTGRRQEGQWDEASFLEELARISEPDVAVARRLLEWAEDSGLRIWWGKGRQTGSLFPVLDHGQEGHTFVALWTNGTVQGQFGQMQRKIPFTDLALRREFGRRLSRVAGVEVTEDMLDRFPSFGLEGLRAPDGMRVFLGALDWAVAEVRNASGS
jgi:hypothetical protein